MQYKKQKGTQWKQKVSGKSKKCDEKEQQVAITIGYMSWNEKEQQLKPIRGKRMMLKTSNMAPYAEIHKQAEMKWNEMEGIS